MFGTIIDVDALRLNVGRVDWVIVDTRFDLMSPQAGIEQYHLGHIPGAYYAHLDHDLSGPVTVISGRHPLPHADDFEMLMNRWGVHADTQVVVYDSREGAIAARLWWLLRWAGHRRVAVLNGGLAAWLRAGFHLDSELPPARHGQFQISIHPELSVSTNFIVNHLPDRNQRSDGYLLIDARAAARFRGEIEPIDACAGHVPGALNMPYQHFLDAEGLFLSAERLHALFGLMFDTPSAKDVVCMCGSGVTACHLLLALEIAGFGGARLYPGSWSEWIRDPRRPVESIYGLSCD